MKRRNYTSFEDWQVDYKRYKENPDDKHLLAYVVKCIENSSILIKNQIKDFLSDSILETNPWSIFDRVGKANPNHRVFVKDQKDPWFIC